MLKQQQNLRQQQRLTPQQIQVIKMLEYPTVELEERIREEIVNNPALEVGEKQEEPQNEEKDNLTQEDLKWDYNDDDEDSAPDYRFYINNRSTDNNNYQNEQTYTQDLGEYLIEQLHTLNIPASTRQLAEYIIGNLDSNGYIHRSDDEILDDMAMTIGIAVNQPQLSEAFAIVQSLEPAGVGAHNLQESLLIQLRQSPKPNHITSQAITVVDKHFDALGRHQYDSICRKMNITGDELNEIIGEIQRLNPNPGSNYGSAADTIKQTITPDFIVEINGNDLIVSLNNGNIPELHVSPEYNNMVRDYNANPSNQNREMREAIQFAKQKIDAAQWFIDSIRQRNNTLLSTMKAIVQLQRNYFLTGDEKQLKPMRLKDIADIVDYEISTISRVSNSKYVDTIWGIFPLKHFFSDGITIANGEEISNREIKQRVQEIIDGEDKSNPITDDQIAATLTSEGYNIARRTVAKYREQLLIPTARMRRKI